MNEEIFNSAKRVSPYIMERMIDFAKLGMNLLFISNGSAESVHRTVSLSIT